MVRNFLERTALCAGPGSITAPANRPRQVLSRQAAHRWCKGIAGGPPASGRQPQVSRLRPYMQLSDKLVVGSVINIRRVLTILFNSQRKWCNLRLMYSDIKGTGSLRQHRKFRLFLLAFVLFEAWRVWGNQ